MKNKQILQQLIIQIKIRLIIYTIHKMGNLETKLSNLNQEFQIIPQNMKYGCKIVKSKMTHSQQYLLRQWVFCSKEQAYHRYKLLQQQKQQQYSLKVVRSYIEQQNSLCGAGVKIYALLQIPQSSLKEQYQLRKKQQNFYTQLQLWEIIYEIVTLLMHFQQQKSKITSFNLQDIYTTKNGKLYKIMNPCMDCENNYEINENNQDFLIKRLGAIILQLGNLEFPKTFSYLFIGKLYPRYSSGLVNVINQMLKNYITLAGVLKITEKNIEKDLNLSSIAAYNIQKCSQQSFGSTINKRGSLLRLVMSQSNLTNVKQTEQKESISTVSVLKKKKSWISLSRIQTQEASSSKVTIHSLMNKKKNKNHGQTKIQNLQNKQNQPSNYQFTNSIDYSKFIPYIHTSNETRQQNQTKQQTRNSSSQNIQVKESTLKQINQKPQCQLLDLEQLDIKQEDKVLQRYFPISSIQGVRKKCQSRINFSNRTILQVEEESDMATSLEKSRPSGQIISIVRQEQLQFIIQQYENNSYYEGYTKNGMKQGIGKLSYKDGGRYQGQWHFNQMHGFGILYYESGAVAYQGFWKKGQFHGKGRLLNEKPSELPENGIDYTNLLNIRDGWTQYEGQFFEDAKHGYGIIKLSNGQLFEGQWVNNKANGNGCFLAEGNKIIKGIWKDNLLMQ